MLKNIQDMLLTYRGIKLYNDRLSKHNYLPTHEIRAIQAKWLIKLLKHCRENIPWYSDKFRTYGVNTDGSDPFSELEKLPILTKSEVRNNHGDFCISGASKSSIKFSTSGTTGEPLHAYTSPSQWVIEQAVIWRQWKWAGYRFRDKIAVLRSYTPRPGQPLIKVDRLRNWAYFSVFHMDDESINKYVDFLIKWRPRFLRGYPSSLMLIAQHSLRHGWKMPSLQAAFSASEMVPETLRENLRAAFGIELFDHYGQAEITCMFHDCEAHAGMHIDWEYGFVELVPSNDLGEYKIIATNLHNTAMPLLRYDTGDIIEGNWERCKCGRSSPIVRKIRGRSDDFIITNGNEKMSTVNLYTYFSKLDGIARFQLVQDTAGALKVLLRLIDQRQQHERGPKIARKVIDDLGLSSGLSISVDFPEQFAQSVEGKFPVFIQKVGKC